MKSIYSSQLISRDFFTKQNFVISMFLLILWKNCHAKLFSSNQFYSKRLIIWRKICEKTVAVKFSNFQRVTIILFPFHSREISYFFLSLRFYVKSMVKDPFSAIFWALNFVDLVNINFLKVQNSSKSKFRDAQSVQMADFDTLDLAILISRKIWLRKFMKFPNCEYSLVQYHLGLGPYFPCPIVPLSKY